MNIASTPSQTNQTTHWKKKLRIKWNVMHKMYTMKTNPVSIFLFIQFNFKCTLLIEDNENL